MASIGFYIWLIIIFLPNKISDQKKKIIEIKKLLIFIEVMVVLF